MPTRRTFLASSAATLLHSLLQAQAVPPAPTTRPNLAVIDHDRILAAARVATPPPTSRQSPDSPAFLAFTLSLPALAAASYIDVLNAPHYAALATTQLKAWFLAAETRLKATDIATGTAFEPILDYAALAEVALALPFLQLEPDLLAELKRWFAEYLAWLTTSRTALLARDERNHHASSWLLQTSAYAQLTANDPVTTENRHRFKTVTLRAQVNAEGIFPHEVTNENPFRYSLLNLDLLAGCCVLLSTRFDSVWEHELQDGPGMRSVIARHAMYIADRRKWPYPADLAHFNLLPGRRPALLFAARAYSAPDYVTLWRTLNPDPGDPDILRTFPIRQPILWQSQPHAQI